MTLSSDAPRPSKMQLVYHHLPNSIIWLIIVSYISSLVPTLERFFAIWLLPAVIVLIMLNLLFMKKHSPGDCYTCTDLRFTGEIQTIRNLPRLAKYHWIRRPRIIVPLIACWIIVIWLPEPAHWAVNSAVNLVAAYFFWLLLTHDKLREWCPWCRNRGDGGGWNDQVPSVPEPTPPGKQLNV